MPHSTIFGLLAASLLVSSCKQESNSEKTVEVVDVRERLLESARQLEGFPIDDEVKLMEFAYLGYATSNQGKIYVVSMHSVLTGMLAPRGQGAIMFFNSEYRHLGSLDSADYPTAAFCRGGFLFFYGRSKGLPSNSSGTINNGNALDLSLGWKGRKMVDIYEYGSSGGIEDPVPNAAQRERERKEWDGGYEWSAFSDE